MGGLRFALVGQDVLLDANAEQAKRGRVSGYQDRNGQRFTFWSKSHLIVPYYCQ